MQTEDKKPNGDSVGSLTLSGKFHKISMLRPQLILPGSSRDGQLLEDHWLQKKMMEEIINLKKNLNTAVILILSGFQCRIKLIT